MPLEKKKGRADGEDRISGLPEELIHHILSFADSKSAVQTCILSRRWRHIWITLPHLNLERYSFRNWAKSPKFLTKFFTGRHLRSDIFAVNLQLPSDVNQIVLKMILSYAIDRNVQEITIDTPVPVRPRLPSSIFSAKSLKKLRICGVFGFHKEEGLCWCLPGLTALDISCSDVPESCFNLPALTTLHLGFCALPKSLSGLPLLTTLHLRFVQICEDKSLNFSELVNLKNLTLEECKMESNVFSISSLQLSNLGISSYLGGQIDEILISAPNLSSFRYCGPLKDYVFPLTLPSLHEVNLDIRIYVWTHGAATKLIGMLQELRNVKFLTINWVIIEVLSLVLDLDHLPSQLKNLKLLKVKVDRKSSRSTIPRQVRTFLLGGSPSATILMEFSKNCVDLALAVPKGVEIVDLDGDEA